jgi:RNA-directed DNA polymerase
MLRLVRMWLKVPVEERDERGTKRMSGGRRSRAGTPQGGVISPLLANVYMHRFLRYWHQCGMGDQFKARVVNYADDFVICCRGDAAGGHGVDAAGDGPAGADAQRHQDVRA